MNQRLQKILSAAGIASRRAAEEYIAQGRVMVNGQTVTELGTKADPAVDEIKVDGRRLKTDRRLRYILLYKPKGYITSRSDPQRRPTVIDLLTKGGVREYVYPVGRLDYDSEGLLLLTSDGELAARLTHPRHGVEREYEVKVLGVPDDEQIARLRTGVPLDGQRTAPADVALARTTTDGKYAVLSFIIREGRNRQVRRMCEAIGHPVSKLRRVRIGPISDPHIRPGEFRDLDPKEVTELKRAAAGERNQGPPKDFTTKERSKRSPSGGEKNQRQPPKGFTTEERSKRSSPGGERNLRQPSKGFTTEQRRRRKPSW